jgi:DNA-directed RNA polymerase specialized sigma54-like protein
MRSGLPRREARRLEAFLHRLELLDQRKTTLYAMLEALLETQMVFFVDGDPDHRSVLTRQTIASRLHVSPVMLDWLISNKSIELPWGVEAPLEAFVPAEKSLLRDRLHGLAMAHPDFSDEDLSDEMELQFGVKIPARSIAEYRKEINIKSPSTAAMTQQSFSRSRFDDIWAEGLQVEN